MGFNLIMEAKKAKLSSYFTFIPLRKVVFKLERIKRHSYGKVEAQSIKGANMH